MTQPAVPSGFAIGSLRSVRQPIGAALMVITASIALSGCGDMELESQWIRRGDVSGEKVAFAPPRPLKPKRDLIHAKDGRYWRRMINDGLHDSQNPDFKKLREPATTLAKLPGKREEIGNNVNWVAALRQGRIAPKDRLKPGPRSKRYSRDIIMPRTAAMPMVRFSHVVHGEWLDCANCHDKLFVKKAGANRFNMEDILAGEYCGRCHGAVAFPLTDCSRCHSVKRQVEVAN